MAFPLDQMTDEVVISERTGVTGFGDAAFGEETTESWHLEPGFKLVTDQRGQEATASLFGIGPGDTVLQVGWAIAWGGRRYRAIDVQPIRFGGEAHHTEAYFESVAS